MRVRGSRAADTEPKGGFWRWSRAATALPLRGGIEAGFRRAAAQDDVLLLPGVLRAGSRRDPGERPARGLGPRLCGLIAAVARGVYHPSGPHRGRTGGGLQACGPRPGRGPGER